MSVGEYLREQRIKKGLTHDELAVAAGVSKRALIYWEQGKRSMGVEYADKVFKALGVSIKLGA